MPEGPLLNVASLKPEKKALFLSVLGTRLTVLSRELYLNEGQLRDIDQHGRAFNEMFHKIFGQLDHIFDKTEQGYSDDVFEASLSAMAMERGIFDQFRKAWNSATEYVSQNS
jgi:hypothetical protein